MAKTPPIDLSGLINILKQDGKMELRTACLGKEQQSFRIFSEWNNIIKVLETEIIPVLSKGGELTHLAAPAKRLAKSAGVLASLASQILSFVPGPIGIVCSVINAIVCFCTYPFPINIGNGMLELLGCIPGGKVAAKGGAKLAPKIEKTIIAMLKKSPEINKIIKDSEKIVKSVKEFAKNKTHSKELSNNKLSSTTISRRKVGFYRELNNYNSGTMPSLESSILANSKNSSMIKTGTPYGQNVTTNKMQSILNTKTGKNDPYSHLY